MGLEYLTSKSCVQRVIFLNTVPSGQGSTGNLKDGQSGSLSMMSDHDDRGEVLLRKFFHTTGKSRSARDHNKLGREIPVKDEGLVAKHY